MERKSIIKLRRKAKSWLGLMVYRLALGSAESKLFSGWLKGIYSGAITNEAIHAASDSIQDVDFSQSESLLGSHPKSILHSERLQRKLRCYLDMLSQQEMTDKHVDGNSGSATIGDIVNQWASLTDQDGLSLQLRVYPKLKALVLKWQQGLTRLAPNIDYDTIKLIFDMLLAGARFGAIKRDLKNRGIPSPTGNSEWNKTSISYIARHPVYAGRYYALRSEAITPILRKGNTYGKSSVRRVPLDEAHWIHQIEVINPPIRWAQREQLIRQLEAHQKLAQRNAKREYLLRGFIFCNTHYGKDGKPRRYHGQPDGKSGKWRYSCPVGGCKHPSLPGSQIEE